MKKVAAKPKIVIVEDDRFLQRILVSKFQKEGYQTFSADNADDAFGLIREHLPDVVTLDLVLRHSSGFDVLAGMKDDAQTKAVPVIVLSNLSSDAEVRKAMTLGARTYLIKGDVSMEEVVKKVKDLSGKS